MDRFSQRASVLLGYSPQSSFVNHSSSSKIPFGDSDVDFNDVFGGPPRRSSIYERCSFSGITDSSSSFSGNSEGPRFRSPWSGLSDKPVFGEEILIRRRYPSDDFYDDIFRSDESMSSTPPRNGCRDPFASSPGSRVLSPVRPLPPKSESFVNSSFPAQFSLPPTLTKGMDIPTFCSATRSVYNNDGASNGIICSHSPNTSLSSRFSSQGIQYQEELKNDVRSQSSLSNEFSLSSEGSICLTKSDKIDTGGNLKKDSNGMEVTIDSNQFHFSIYKWASKGIPFSTRLNGKNGSRLKQMGKAERCSSTNGRIESERLLEELSMRTPCNTDFPSSANTAANSKSSRMDHTEQEDNSHLDTQYRLEPCRIVEETVFPILESEIPSSIQDTVEDVPEQTLLCNMRETPSHLLPKTVSSEKSSVATQEAQKPELKSLRSLLYDNDDEQGCVEKARKVGGEEIKVSSGKKSSDNVDVVKNVEKLDGKSTLNNAEDRKASLQGSPMISQDKPERNRVKGKIKEFVKIFDQEASSKEKLDVDSRNLSSRWKERSSFRRESFRATKTDEKIYTPDMNKMNNLTDACITADNDIKKSEEQQSTAAHYVFSDTYLGLKDSSGSASISDGFEATVVNTDEFFQGDFLVKELPPDENKLPELHQDENKLPPIGEDPEDIQVADAKICKWSKGREGNIRSLLSTLQYVLWPDSGWKPVPLVDIIEGNKVKRAYQKALLCLHPDKLQQKGAALHKKYMAEKVFDILQEAWTHFNTLSSL